MNNKNCTCEEPHISDRIQHMYDGSPCYVKTTPTTPSEWDLRKKEILGEFNAGQFALLTQNGSVTMSADEQRKEGEYNCRDAKIAVEKTEEYWKQRLHHNTEEIIDVISGKLRQYKEYYNPIGDARNQGKHALADDILEELRALKPTHKE